MIVLKWRNRTTEKAMVRFHEGETCEVTAAWAGSVVCSKHFKPDGLAQRLDVQEETPWLKRDEFGITASRGFVQPLLHLRNSSQSVELRETEEWLHISMSKCSLPWYILFPFFFNFLNKNYFLQALKAAVKRNVGSTVTSHKPQSKMAKVCQCETPEAIPNTGGVSSEVQQEPLAEPPVILNDLHVSDPSEAQNIIEECDNCALLNAKNRKLRNLTYCKNNIRWCFEEKLRYNFQTCT